MANISFDDLPTVSDQLPAQPPTVPKRVYLDFSDIPEAKRSVFTPAPESPDHGLVERQKQGVAGRLAQPVTEWWPTYLRMNQEARDLIASGASDIAKRESLTDPAQHGLSDVLQGGAKMGLGALGYVASPISAAYRTAIGQPVEDLTGIPREYPEFAAQLATPGLGLPGMVRAPGEIPPPGVITRPIPRPPEIEPRIPGVPATGEQVAAAANRLSATGEPVEIPRAVASDSPVMQQVGKISASSPTGTPLVTAAEKTLGQLGTKAQEVAGGYGETGSVAETGGRARAAISDWITGTSKAKADKLYDRVDEFVKPDTTAPLDNTLKEISAIAGERAQAGLGSTPAMDAAMQLATHPQGGTYQGIKTLRTEIGNMLNQGLLPGAPKDTAAKRLYGALSKDLNNVVQASGPEAQAAFSRANRYYDLVSDRRKDLAKIVGAQGDAPAELVFDRMKAMASSGSRADIAKLAQARKAIGADDWNEVASTVAGRLGRDPSGKFSPDLYIADWNKISPDARQILFRSTDRADLAQHLDDIATVSSRFKELQKYANLSGSGRHVIGAALFKALLVEPLTAISGAIGHYALSDALATPAKAASIAKYARAQEALVRAPDAAKLARFNIASRNLASTLNIAGQGNVAGRGRLDFSPQRNQ